MDVAHAIASQYRAGLLMLRQCISICPDESWVAGEHPRSFWRIAYHAVFYTHFYLMPDHESFLPWERHCWHGRILWDDDEDGLPPAEHPYTQADLLEYVDIALDNVAGWVAALDLDASESGFPWYPMSKLEHQLVNIRHLGIHVGQLQELLYARGLEPRWVGRG